MIALSHLSWAIVAFLVAVFVWIGALMKTAKRADEYMSQAWLEEQRRKDSE